MQNIKQQILDNINNINLLLEQAKCDNVAINTCEDVYTEINSAINTLEQTVDYYVD